jgi:hypothetical protein
VGAISHTADFSPPILTTLGTQSQLPKSSLRFHFNVGPGYHYPKSQNSVNHLFSANSIKKLLLPSTSHSASDDPAPSADHPSTHPDVPDGLLEFASFSDTLEKENTANFAAAMEWPPAFWNHATSNAEHDALYSLMPGTDCTHDEFSHFSGAFLVHGLLRVTTTTGTRDSLVPLVLLVLSLLVLLQLLLAR